MKFLLPFLALTITMSFTSPVATTDAEARERQHYRTTHADERHGRERPERTRNYQTLIESPTIVTTKKPVTEAAEPAPEVVEVAPVVVPPPVPVTEVETVPEKPVIEEVIEVVEEPIVEPTPEPAPELSYLEAIAAEIHRLTNLERAEQGLPTLATDSTLAAIAEAHSEDMLTRDYFSHTAPGGCDLTCRFENADYAAWAWGENIAWRQSSNLPSAEKLAEHFFENWMDSKSHRDNILAEDYTHEGIGLAQEDNIVYVTVNFAEPE